MKTDLMKNTLIMTAINLIIRFVGLFFNGYLTETADASFTGLFQLILSVHSLAVTFSSAGIRLATTRITVRTKTLSEYDTEKSVSVCMEYAGFCGCAVCIAMLIFSKFISKICLDNLQTELPLKILSLSLPFTAISSSLSGFFTAIDCVPQFSAIQLAEQIIKVMIVLFCTKSILSDNPIDFCIIVVIGMTVSEMFSVICSLFFKKTVLLPKTEKKSIKISEILKIAIPDAIGTYVRNILVTVEHILIPKCLKSNGNNDLNPLSEYGNIHALAIPVLLFPSSFLISVSSLLIPTLAEMYESGDYTSINLCVSRTLKRTVIYSLFCSAFFFLFSVPSACLFCKTKEAAKYIRILSPLIPVMYTDIITDGMLKGLDRQVQSMKFNIIDSSLCVILVRTLLPKYSVKGYIFVLYISEIINFTLSINLLRKICVIRCFRAHEEENSRFFPLKKYSIFQKEYEYQTYPDRMKHNRDLQYFR